VAGLTFAQQLILTLIDKAVIGGLLVFSAFGFNKLLEAFKSQQTRQLEIFKAEQAQQLETFKSERSHLLEAFRNQLSRRDEAARNVRVAVAEVAKGLAAGSHAICWLCWMAKYSPKEMTSEQLRSYEKEINTILSELVGSRVILAALDEKIHSSLSPLVKKLYSLDVQVGEATVLYASSPEEGLKALAKLHRVSLEFDDELLEAVTNLVSIRETI
jgi:hypothetical protein